MVVQDSYNMRGDRGLSDFDARHRFVINWLYELPFKGNRLVEGWQFSSITQLQSGNPVNLVTNINSFTGTMTDGLATLRPDLIGPITILEDPRPMVRHLHPSWRRRRRRLISATWDVTS